MESMHFAAQLAIEQNMKHMTAFSARPDSPIAPIRTPRSLAIGRTWRRLTANAKPRSTAALAPATGACN